MHPEDPVKSIRIPRHVPLSDRKQARLKFEADNLSASLREGRPFNTHSRTSALTEK